MIGALRRAVAFLASVLSIMVTSACVKSTQATEAPPRSDDLVFTGMCDASGAVALSGGRFIVASDEDNVLRIYDSAHPGAPLESLDVTAFLALPGGKKPKEADIEAGARVDGLGLWLTSHGLSSKGKPQPARLRLFATSLSDKNPMTPIGTAYEQLLDDLLEAPQLSHLGLRAASLVAPKDPGGLNLEGMAEGADHASILIGFRNPVPNGRAIVVPILNPRAIIEGQRAAVGAPLLLDLGGLGVRGMSLWHERYLVLGGAVASKAQSRLFLWDGHSSAATPITSAVLGDFNPEGFVVYDHNDSVLLLSDDGSRPIDGQACKRLSDTTRKRFRGRWVDLSAL